LIKIKSLGHTRCSEAQPKPYHNKSLSACIAANIFFIFEQISNDMQTYLSQILPRLQQFNKKLDQISLFTNKPWIMIDEESNQHHYSFLPDGRLVMALNGQAQIGKWEYLSGSNSLLIDRNVDNILLHHIFLTDGIMLLKKEGSNEKPWILVNKNVIPDLNYEKYLRGLYIKKHDLKTFKTIDNNIFYVKSAPNVITFKGLEIFDSTFSPLENSVIKMKSRNLTVTAGRVSEVYYEHIYSTIQNETILIRQAKQASLTIGDAVFNLINGCSTPIDNAILEFTPPITGNKIRKLVVTEGTITRISNRLISDRLSAIFFLLLIIASLIIVITIVLAKS